MSIEFSPPVLLREVLGKIRRKPTGHHGRGMGGMGGGESSKKERDFQLVGFMPATCDQKHMKGAAMCCKLCLASC